jgi:hypothetical protein
MPLNPPQPLPENLWGKQWRFASLSADAIATEMASRPIPILSIPDAHQPLSLGLASTIAIPGIVIDGEKQSRRLAQWIEQVQPQAVDVVTSELNGIILETPARDRWIIATFSDREVQEAAQRYLTRRSLAKGLHFLLVQPDDSGMTYSGFWLLKSANLP